MDCPTGPDASPSAAYGRQPPTGDADIRTIALALLAAVVVACGTSDVTDDTPDAVDRPGTEGIEVTEPTVGTSPAPGAAVPGAGGGVTLDVGDETFQLDVDSCFASPEDGITFRGTSELGHRLEIDFAGENPEGARIYLTDESGEALWSSDASVSGYAPRFEVADDGSFNAQAVFTNPTGEQRDGQLSGAC